MSTMNLTLALMDTLLAVVQKGLTFPIAYAVVSKDEDYLLGSFARGPDGEISHEVKTGYAPRPMLFPLQIIFRDVDEKMAIARFETADAQFNLN